MRHSERGLITWTMHLWGQTMRIKDARLRAIIVWFQLVHFSMTYNAGRRTTFLGKIGSLQLDCLVRAVAWRYVGLLTSQLREHWKNKNICPITTSNILAIIAWSKLVRIYQEYSRLSVTASQQGSWNCFWSPSRPFFFESSVIIFLTQLAQVRLRNSHGQISLVMTMLQN